MLIYDFTDKLIGRDIPRYLISSPVFSGNHVAQSKVCFCLFHSLSFHRIFR